MIVYIINQSNTMSYKYYLGTNVNVETALVVLWIASSPRVR